LMTAGADEQDARHGAMLDEALRGAGRGDGRVGLRRRP
jgi:hypothetical protein